MFRINFRLVGGVDRSLSDICVFAAIQFISRLGPRELSRTVTAEGRMQMSLDTKSSDLIQNRSYVRKRALILVIHRHYYWFNS